MDFSNHIVVERRYVDIKYLSTYIGFKEPTIRDWIRFRKIPYLKVSKGIRFDLQRIDQWLEQKQVEN